MIRLKILPYLETTAVIFGNLLDDTVFSSVVKETSGALTNDTFQLWGDDDSDKRIV